MKGFSFIRQSRLHDVCGRVNYISSQERQEHLYASYGTNPNPFWKELAKECQTEFSRSGTVGKCVEARELIIALPRSLEKYDTNALLKQFTDAFKEKYGVECSSALHHNKTMTNYHIHLIYAERQRLTKPLEKIASRNMYFDENGKKVRTKKEICIDGKLRDGCSMIKKGEVYGRHLFSKKNEVFKAKSFLRNVKKDYTEMINGLARDDEKLEVFNRDSPYIATKKIGKNNPMAAEIKEDNKARDEWNRRVNEAFYYGLTKEALCEVKKSEILEPIKKSKEENGQSHSAFRKIILRAADTTRNLIRQFQRTPKDRRVDFLTKDLREIINFCRAAEQKFDKGVRKREGR